MNGKVMGKGILRPVGSWVTPECPAKFHPVGALRATCREDGKFFPSTLYCEAGKKCATFKNNLAANQNTFLTRF